jgi:tetratricopeptide (TPR) repeat protein
MNKIILLTILIGLNVHAQHAHAISLMLAQQIQAQEKQLDLKMQLQNQKIENLQNQVDKAINHQALRKQVLDSQENTISWWLSIIGIVFAFGGVFGYFFIKGKIEEFKQLNKDAQEELEKIKQHEKTAKQGVENISKLSNKVKQILLNPKKTPSEEIFKEVRQAGTELEKMIVEARQLEKSGKIQAAIDLWQQILGIAKYQSNKEGQTGAYFYLSYLYGQNAIDYEKSIAFSNKAIKIKPDFHEAYYNMGVVYAKLGEHQQALEAYQKAIKIKPDKYETYNNMGVVYAKLGKHQQALEAYQKAVEIKPDKYETYYNMGNAYDAMKNFDKAIDNYNTAIKINPSIGKEIEPEDWKILTHRIKALNDSTIRQQYQEIFNQLKGEKNKR